MYFTYMIRCEDNSIYTGYTNDLEKRMKAHFVKAKIAAKYTKSHKPKNVEAVWRTKEKVLACKLEYQIKQLSKMEKEELIKTKKLGKFFKGKFDCRKFSNVKNIMI
ncbi:MAG: GIY-YIG nuclease family protein [Clostridia bacterium]|nr:GIY-YIG nuclease family protein [Clostridia bacterium]